MADIFGHAVLASEPLAPLPRVIGYDRNGEMIWAAAGGRGGIDFAVDDRDGDEPDDFDEEDDDFDEEDDEPDDEPDDDDDVPDVMRGKKTRQQAAQRAARGNQRQGDDAEEGDDDWEPPTRERMAKIEAALARNNAENNKNRHVRKILDRLNIKDADEFVEFMIDRGLDPDTGDPLSEDEQRTRQREEDDLFDDTSTGRTREQLIADRRRAEERGSSRAEAQWKPAVVQFAAAQALQESGFTSKNIATALRLLDLDSIDVELDASGPIVFGLDEQVEALKQDFPDLFRKPRQAADEERQGRRRTGGRTINGTRTGARAIDGGERGRSAPKPRGWQEQLLRQMTGGRR